MEKFFGNDRYTLYHGNMLNLEQDILPESIDSIVTDPPYELGFMGKSWDSQGVTFQADTWKKCFNALKPGGYLLAFGGSRTFHRIACAIEDAGFEIRDTIMWLYGSGFPKSMSISKGIESRERFGNAGTRNKRLIEQSCDGEEFVVKQTNNGAMGEIVEATRKQYVPTSELAKKWDGWGTCLKPAYEPVIVARKPFSGSLIDNILEYGVGGINIDGCRVPLEDGYKYKETNRVTRNDDTAVFSSKTVGFKNENNTIASANPDGRFPSNVILTYNETDREEVCDGFPYTKNGGGELTMPDFKDAGKKNSINKVGYNDGETAKRKPYVYAGREYNNKDTSMFNGDKPQAPSNYADDGSAARYFMNCQINKKDTDDLNITPNFEPIIVARKPFDGSIVDNVLTYGVGGLNIDECRVPFEDTPNPATNPLYRLNAGYKTTSNLSAGDSIVGFGTSKNETSQLGRFPANVMLTYDETDEEEVCSGFPQSKGANSQNNYSNGSIYRGQSLQESSTKLEGFREWYNDDGSAARYFYCAKASKKDRNDGCDNLPTKLFGLSNQAKAEINRGNDNFSGNEQLATNALNKVQHTKNNHPTVKPTELMQYLIRLVTPNGGTILDPFNGSGSTGKAAMFENKERNKDYKYIGIELDEDYLKISKARIDFAIGTSETNWEFETEPNKNTESNTHKTKSLW